MGVYIPGMEMPTSCMLCPFCVEEADPANGEMCMVTGTLMPPCTRERLDNCPLIHVPEHGDLIDRDKLEKDIDKYIGGEESRSRFHHWVQVQRSVIPKSEEAQT